MKPREFGEPYAASQIAKRNSWFRSRIKQRYLDRVLPHVDGATVDIGCGAGQLLEQLPPGSIGLEVNPVLVRSLQAKGLPIRQISPSSERVVLDDLPPGSYRTAILSHVLEHFSDAAAVLRRLMDDCRARSITRLIVVVPGRVGYASDATHRTFVTLDYLRANALLGGPQHRVVASSFFPGDIEGVGDWFVYHELMIVYDIVPTGEVAATAPFRREPAYRGWVQFASFVAVGVLNTAFSYSIYAALVFLGLNFAVANLTALVIGILFSFKTQGLFVFKNSENRRLLRFVAVWALIYLFGTAVISRFIAAGFNHYAAGALAIPFTTVLSYLAQKYFVFRNLET